jgi:cytidine deaminase
MFTLNPKNSLIVTIFLSTLAFVLLVAASHNKKLNQSCFHQEGFEKAVEYFQKNPDSVVIAPDDFQNIVNACEGDIERALLCTANAVAYQSVTKQGGPVPKHSQNSQNACVGPAASHTVVSNYPVGACVLSSVGRVYIGANFEFNGMLIPTVHGEQCAVHNALVNRRSPTEHITKLAVNAAPCGSCRQYLVEIGNPSNLQVVFCSNDNHFSSQPLDKLIIENFGPINLGEKENVFDHAYLALPQPDMNPTPYRSVVQYTNKNGQWISKKASIGDGDSSALQYAIEMWKKSYAPYTSVNVGIALKFTGNDDNLVGGMSLENAAYNPSVSAIRGAFSLASIMGKNNTQNKSEKCSFKDTLSEIIVCVSNLGKSSEIQNIQVQEILHYLDNLELTVPVTIVTIDISRNTDLSTSLSQPKIRRLPL